MHFRNHFETTAARARLARRATAALAVAALIAVGGPAAQAQNGKDAWIDTWSASPQPVWSPDFLVPVAIPRSLVKQTIRQVARISLGGEQVRVELSNTYGTEPLTVGPATVALAGDGGAIEPGTSHALTFSGHDEITIPPGASVWSDPAPLAVEPLSELAVSLYLPKVSPTTTWHRDGRQTAYIGAGDQTAAETFDPSATIEARIYLSGIAVDAAPDARSVVLFGDSITDGDSSTVDANARWPDVLAERLVEAGIERAVLNEGISGARVLRDRMGVNALARFDADVLSHPRADTVVVMMGINDIGWPGTLLTPDTEPAPSVEAIIAGYKQLIARAHAHGLRIYGATLTPFEETFAGNILYGYHDAEKEAKRQAVNDFIRNSGAFDGVIDFDAVVQDPDNPARIRSDYDSGDHLHPNDAGYAAMGNAVDLDLLRLD